MCKCCYILRYYMYRESQREKSDRLTHFAFSLSLYRIIPALGACGPCGVLFGIRSFFILSLCCPTSTSNVLVPTWTHKTYGILPCLFSLKESLTLQDVQRYYYTILVCSLLFLSGIHILSIIFELVCSGGGSGGNTDKWHKWKLKALVEHQEKNWEYFSSFFRSFFLLFLSM